MKPDNPLSILQLTQIIPDEAAAVKIIADARWPNGPECPHCNSNNVQCGAKHPSMKTRMLIAIVLWTGIHGSALSQGRHPMTFRQYINGGNTSTGN